MNVSLHYSDLGYIKRIGHIMKLGNIVLATGASVAPMAGVADKAFRELCYGYGAVMATGEMASAKGISLGSEKSKELLEKDSYSPFGVQLFGDDPNVIATATKIAEQYSPDFIDLNMGCPAPKIVGGGGGSALMKTPKLAESIIKSLVSSTELPVTVKIRLGWDQDSKNAVEIAKIVEASGAVAVGVHGRTRVQMYAPPVDLTGIKEVKQAVSIPVIGNGDITTPELAKEMLEFTGCDLVMVGRGALGKPWLFSQIKDYLETGSYQAEPELEERITVMKRHMELLVGYKGEKIGFREARKHIAWYLTGFRGAAQLRKMCGGISSFEDIELIYQEVRKL